MIEVDDRERFSPISAENDERFACLPLSLIVVSVHSVASVRLTLYAIVEELSRRGTENEIGAVRTHDGGRDVVGMEFRMEATNGVANAILETTRFGFCGGDGDRHVSIYAADTETAGSSLPGRLRVSRKEKTKRRVRLRHR